MMIDRIYISIWSVSAIILLCVAGIMDHTDDLTKQSQIVAEVISGEACSEGPLAMMGIASVINNRMKAENKSAYQIVTEKNQFYALTNPNRQIIFTDPKCSIPATQLAKIISELPDVVNGALYFKTKDEPRQKWHKSLLLTINNMEFWR